MGIRGLATFINHYSYKYLEDHKLQNCHLVIDGNSLACQLYLNCTKVNGAFGGDYDRYATSVVEFFNILQKCNIAPIVIFDGGYESQKLRTTFIRMREKWRSAKNVTPGKECKRVFPLFLKETIKDVLKELEIPFAQCLFEADVEIAAVARNLKCPVLSYDSDYFVYNVLYIPYPTVHAFPYKDGSTQSTDQSYYLYCKIYRVENFLKQAGGLQREILPFLSIMLGCDYVGNRVYKMFVSNLKQKNSRGLTRRHKRITSLLEWLRTETLESAKTKVLGCLRKHRRSDLKKQIDKIISLYVDGSSELLSVLGIEVPCLQSEYSDEAKNVLELLKAQEEDTANDDVIDDADVIDDYEGNHCEDIDDCEDFDGKEDFGNYEGLDRDDTNDLNISACVSGESESSIESEDEIEVCKDEIEETQFESAGKLSKEIKKASLLPEWFLQHFKEGQFPSVLMDMFVHQYYFLSPQVEDYDNPSSHIISLPLISVIYGLMVGCSSRFLRCVVRKFRDDRFVDVHPVLESESVKFPPLNDLPNLSMPKRFLILMETAGLNSDDQKCIISLPLPWQLYVIALVFWARQTQPVINNSHIDSLLLCLILLNVVGKSVMCVGSKKRMRNRRKKNLLKIKSSGNNKTLLTSEMIANNKAKTTISPTQNNYLGVERLGYYLDFECEEKKENESVMENTSTNLDAVVETLQGISSEECGCVKKQLRPFCLLEEKLKARPKLFCISTVHSFAQFQSCLLHLTYLNALLGFPLLHCASYQAFSGTFVYNMYNNLNRRSNSFQYISQLLSSSPSIVALFKVLRETTDKLIPNKSSLNSVKKKRRKKKQRTNTEELIKIVNDSEDQSVDSDFEDPCNRFAALALNH